MRQDVDDANNSRLDQLRGPVHKYIADDLPGRDIRGDQISPDKAEQILERLVAAKEVTLKVRTKQYCCQAR